MLSLAASMSLVQVLRMEQLHNARLKVIARPMSRDTSLITAIFSTLSSSRAQDLSAGGNMSADTL